MILNKLKKIDKIYTMYSACRAYIRYLKNAIEINKIDASTKDLKWEGYIHYPKMITPIPVAKPDDYDRDGFSDSRVIDEEVGKLAVEVIDKLKNTIIKVVGENARLDDIVVSWFDPSKKIDGGSMSGGWHTDNVGHRIKLYICLKGDGTTPTKIIPRSQEQNYIPSFEEILRIMGYVKKDRRRGEVDIRYQSGDVCIFDTHALHRGAYEESTSERVVIILEFMDKKKSNLLSGSVSCGPGNGPNGRVIFNEKSLDLLRGTYLIDEDLIHEDGDEITYSLKNLNQMKTRR